MLYYTPIEIAPSEETILHQDSIMLMGSCFTTHIADKLKYHLFNVLANPFGVLYNPASIEQSIAIIKEKKTIVSGDFFLEEDIYKSYLFHSHLAGNNLDSLLVNINNIIEESNLFLKQTKWFFVTLGTAYVYELKNTGEIVANCHKQNAQLFNHRMLTVEETSKRITKIYKHIIGLSAEARVVFTVSPVRHLKQGAHLNQISKASLLLSIHQALSSCKQAYYFPSYELFMDELRDYRFYAKDMLHPSEIGIEHVWSRFSETFFNKETLELNRQIKEVKLALEHKPLFPDSKSYQLFKKNLEQKIEWLKEKKIFIPPI